MKGYEIIDKQETWQYHENQIFHNLYLITNLLQHKESKINKEVNKHAMIRVSIQE